MGMYRKQRTYNDKTGTRHERTRTNGRKLVTTLITALNATLLFIAVTTM